MSDHPSNFEPLRFKNINLKILMPWIPRYGFLIDELISYFYPRTLLVEVNSDAPKYNYFTQVLLDGLKNWKRKSESSMRLKHSDKLCWHYFLKDFKIL